MYSGIRIVAHAADMLCGWQGPKDAASSFDSIIACRCVTINLLLNKLTRQGRTEALSVGSNSHMVVGEWLMQPTFLSILAVFELLMILDLFSNKSN